MEVVYFIGTFDNLQKLAGIHKKPNSGIPRTQGPFQIYQMSNSSKSEIKMMVGEDWRTGGWWLDMMHQKQSSLLKFIGITVKDKDWWIGG